MPVLPSRENQHPAKQRLLWQDEDGPGPLCLLEPFPEDSLNHEVVIMIPLLLQKFPR